MKQHESRIYESMAERPARPISQDSKLASLDVLRGIAIISVLIAHFWPVYLPAPGALTILFGQFGVTLFFFLSGFLMDRTYADEPRLLPFVIRRTMRILPMYWISILLIFATEPGWTLRDIAIKCDLRDRANAGGQNVRCILDAVHRSAVLCDSSLAFLCWAPFNSDEFVCCDRAIRSIMGRWYTICRRVSLFGILLPWPSVWRMAEEDDHRRRSAMLSCHCYGCGKRLTNRFTVSRYCLALLWLNAAPLCNAPI